jgi:hypothetical protein
LPVLGALADKSLLRKDGARLSLHPLVQHLAGQRLGDDAARHDLERAHGLHFHRLMAQLRRSVADGDFAALQLIESELENCRVAWRWRSGEPRRQPRRARDAAQFCDHRGHRREGHAWLSEAIEPIERRRGEHWRWPARPPRRRPRPSRVPHGPLRRRRSERDERAGADAAR